MILARILTRLPNLPYNSRVTRFWSVSPGPKIRASNLLGYRSFAQTMKSQPFQWPNDVFLAPYPTPTGRGNREKNVIYFVFTESIAQSFDYLNNSN